MSKLTPNPTSNLISNPTMQDVANKANVSNATVSRVLHTPEKVSDSVCKRVRQAIAELNYSYNAAAANMVKGRTSSIGVLAPSMRDSIFASTLVGIQEQAFAHDHHVIVADTKFDAYTEKRLLEKFIEQRLGGIILIGYCPENEDYIIKLVNSGVRIIDIWETTNNCIPFVGIDNYLATKQSMEYLVSLQHTNFAFILGRYNRSKRTRDRYEACKDVVKNNNLLIEENMFFDNSPTIEDGYACMKNILAIKKDITAVYCNSDIQAVGAMQCIRDHNLRVGEDISICGFDDIDTAAYLHTPLTTIKVPAYSIGEIATITLFDNMLHNKKIESKTLEANFIIRNSCAQNKYS